MDGKGDLGLDGKGDLGSTFGFQVEGLGSGGPGSRSTVRLTGGYCLASRREKYDYLLRPPHPSSTDFLLARRLSEWGHILDPTV